MKIMTRLTQAEIQSAKIAAKAVVEAKDALSRKMALNQLFVAAGYWRAERNLSTAAFRGETIPPRMVRMPAGRSVLWDTKRLDAAKAWAAA